MQPIRFNGFWTAVCRGLAFAAILISAPRSLAADEDGDSDQPRHVNLRGQTFEEYPVDLLRAKGVDVREVADDENAALLYIEAYNAAKDLPPDLQEAFDQAQAGTWPEGDLGARLSSWLDENQAALDLARRAANRPHCRMPVFRSEESDSLYMVLLPTLAHHRMLARMLAADSARQQSGGNANAAIDDSITLQKMAGHAAGGFTLIEHLVGVACGELASQMLARAASDPNAGAEHLQRACAEFDAATDAFPTWEQAVRNEQRVGMSALEEVYEHPSGFFNPMAAMTPGSSSGWARLGARVWRVFIPDRAGKRNFARYYDTLIQSALPAGDGEPARLGVTEEALRDQIPGWDIVSTFTIPSLHRSFAVNSRWQSNARRAVMTAAVSAYQKVHGRPPQSLNDLAPEYISAVPIDPETGFEFAYSPNASGGETGLELIARPRPVVAGAAPEGNPPPPAARPEPQPAPLPPSEWRQYTDAFAERFRFDEAQRKAAYGVLGDLEKRAAEYERTKGERIRQLREQLSRTTDAKQREAASAELARLSAPLDGLFEELKKRLNGLPTQAQRATAEQDRGGRK